MWRATPAAAKSSAPSETRKTIRSQRMWTDSNKHTRGPLVGHSVGSELVWLFLERARLQSLLKNFFGAAVLKGHDFRGCGKTLAKGSFVTGHERGTHPVGGSRAANIAK
jgi:hypothetical protein